MTIRSKTGRSHRGAVLILVLVMLSLLAMLAISLATTSVLDRSVSFNYIDEVRARLIAKAGIEHAIARIQAMVQRGQFEDQSLVYWGSKTEETGDPDVDTPLDKALNPSFAIEDEEIQNPDDSKTTPIRFNFDGREVGISGTMSSSTYGRHSDVYRLRVTDANGRINVNDGIFDPDVRKNVERILNHLGDACGVGDLGSTLIAKSPKNGYRSRRELREALGNDKYKRVGDHITPFAWTDHNVVNPVPISLATLGAYPVDYNERLSLYRYGRSQSASGAQISGHLVFAPDYAAPKGFGHAIYAQDEVNAQWIGRTARCPVNVNVASVQVLTALISDLRGVFMTERRKKNPGGGQYTFMYYPKMENRPPTSDVEPRGSELGYLYSTPAFQPPSGDKKTTNKAAYVGGVSAKTVAEEIVACRLRQKSTHGTIDYGAEWFGGPFRTWMQFNAFCDSLVTQGILADGRDIFYDFQPSNQGDGGSWSFGPDWGSDILIPSVTQPKVAAQAMADVLKANFNPNCTLNELNPDRNLYLEVDKTDLICNSTEFCFTSMGYFEIECEGLVIKTPRADDLMRARIGVVQSREMIECVAKIFEIYRDTTQSDFYKGNLGLNVRRLITNSNKPIELGPEPEAGENPEECKWSGWIQLSTLGGIRRPDIKNAVMTTPKAKPDNGAVAFAHYQFDHRLNYHGSDQQHPLQFSGDWGNKPDRTEDHAGPYNPTRGGRGEYRLARDWSKLSEPPAPDYKAMSDLRIDGAYIERDNAMLYPCTEDVFATVGTIGFWFKPAFRPEMTGKARTFFSTDTYTGWQLINSLWFFPAHDTAPYQGSTAELAIPSYAGGPWRPISLCGGYATPGGWGGGVGHATPSLNHSTHKGSCEGSDDIMMHHEWMYAAYKWDMSETKVQVMVNGQLFPMSGGGTEVHVHPQPTSADVWTTANAIFRLGEPSTTMSYPGGSRNWSIDGTVDEFYMWKGNAMSNAVQMFDRGRYHVPRTGQEGRFTSQAITLDLSNLARLADPSNVRPPVREHGVGGGRTTVAGPLDGPKSLDTIKPICAFWTEYPAFIHRLNKKEYENMKKARAGIEVSMQLLVDDLEVGEPLLDGGGSPINGVSIKQGQSFKYRLKIAMTEHSGMPLLATPVIDDVTIMYTTGVEYIYYSRLDPES